MKSFVFGTLIRRGLLVSTLGLGLGAWHAYSQPGTVDGSFNAWPNNNGIAGNAMVVQSDGKVAIGGNFTAVNGTNRNYLARVSTSGGLDADYNPAPNNQVFALALQPSDGSIIVGGQFTSIKGTNRFRLARLFADGNLDYSFGCTNVNNNVNAVQVRGDGKIMIAGDFTSVNGIARNRVARLNDDGSLDLTFDPAGGPDSTVNAMVVQGDGGVIIGGYFGNVQGRQRYYVARLTAAGSLDDSFDPGTGLQTAINSSLNIGVWTLALQADGKILVGGNFRYYNGVYRYGLARVNSDGLVDLSFAPATYGEVVYAVVVQGDGKVVVGGPYSGNYSYCPFYRLMTDGSFDPSFNNGNLASGQAGSTWISALALQPDGRILVGGSFNSFAGVARTNLVRLEGLNACSGGEIEFSSATYQTTENIPYATIEVRRSGNVANTATVGFSTTNGTATALDYVPVSGTLSFGPGESSKTFTVTNLNDALVEDTETVGLLLTGPTGGACLGGQRSAVLKIADDDRYPWLDPLDFGFGYGSSIGRVLVQPDGKFLVAYNFTEVAGVNRRYLARFLPNGQVDTSLSAHIYVEGQSPYSPSINAIAVQADGKMLIGGNFSSVNGLTRYRLARLNVDGSLDQTFDPRDTFLSSSGGYAIQTLAVQDSGLILVGTSFDTRYMKANSGLIRLAQDGTWDTSFVPSVNAWVGTIQPLSGGKLLIAGGFSYVNGVYRSCVARLNADGSLDGSFDPGRGANADVQCIALQNDGKIVLGGSFTTFNGMPRPYLVRLNADGSGDSGFALGNSPDNVVYSLAVQNDGKILAGGYFYTFGPQTNTHGIAKLLNNGSIDPGFDVGIGAAGTGSGPSYQSRVYALAIQTNGGVLVAGDFTQFNGFARNALVRLEAPTNAPGGEIEFTSTSYQVMENAGTATLQVRRNGNTNQAVSVGFSTSNGSANAGDYTPTNGVLTFAAGVTNLALSVRIRDDALVEDPETFFVTLSNNPTGGALLGGYRQATVTILNDDLHHWLDNWNPGFATNANCSITASLLQPDGKLILAGDFSEVGGYNRYRIVRLNSDGSVDQAFKPSAFVENGLIRCISLQDDGMILIGGDFNMVNGITRYYLARLGSDGSLDNSFNPSFNNTVYAVVEQPDSRILVGGQFGYVNGYYQPGIVRLYTDGTFDDEFDQYNLGVNGYVKAIALYPDTGEILIAGNFNSVSGVGRTNIARLYPDSEVDLSFDAMVANYGQPNTSYNTEIRTLVLQADGKILAGGNFYGFNGLDRRCLVRLNPDGLVDASFVSGAGGNGLWNVVNAIALQPDGRVIVGGEFTGAYNYSPSLNHIARLRADGSVDPSFDMGSTLNNQAQGANGVGQSPLTVNTLALLPDGKVVMGGTFTNMNGYARYYCARVFGLTSPSGGIIEFSSAKYYVNEHDTTAVITVQRSGQISSQVQVSFVATNGTADGGDYVLTSGSLTFLPGQTSSTFSVIVLDDTLVENPETVNLAVYSPTGGAELGSLRTAVLTIIDDDNNTSLDRVSFGLNNTVYAGVALPNGKVLLAGAFTEAGGFNRHGLARFNADGSLDTSFNAHADVEGGYVYAIAVQADGKMVLGGDFTSVNGQPRSRVARLDQNGYLDPFFYDHNGGINNSSVAAIAVQPNGRILIGGGFTLVAGVSRNYFARLYADGSLDTTFNPGTGANSSVTTIGLQTNGQVVIGGYFTFVNGSPRNYLARLDQYGALDPAFPAGAGANNDVRAVALQPDSKILVGGEFTTFNGTNRIRLTRLNADGSLDPSFDVGFGPTNQLGSYSYISKLALQSDGRILAGGLFTKFNNNTNYANLVRLGANGALDPSFSLGTGPSGEPYALLVDQYDRAWFGGGFTSVNGLTSYPYLLRLQGTVPAALPQPVRFMAVSFPQAGPLSMILTGVPGGVFIMDRCTDLKLKNWAPISTSTIPTATFQFVDPTATRTGANYYRARTVQ